MYAWLGIALVVIAAEGAVYWAGGVGPRADLEKMVLEVKARTAEIRAMEARAASERQTLITEKDAERAKTAEVVSVAWSAEYRRLQQSASAGGRTPGKSARIVASVCNDPATDQRLSDAVSKSRDGYRSEIGRYRQGIAGLLEACQLQTGDLINVQQYLARARKIGG